MPLAGWLVGGRVMGIMSSWDHWIAFILLSVIGFKMIYESFSKDRAGEVKSGGGMLVLLGLAVATSIDAFAVGLTLGLLTDSVFWAVAVIGAVTFVISYAGVYIGRKFGHMFENYVETAGGIILFSIGLKILVEHISG